MAHPYKDHAADKVGKQRAKAFQTGGRVRNIPDQERILRQEGEHGLRGWLDNPAVKTMEAASGRGYNSDRWNQRRFKEGGDKALDTSRAVRKDMAPEPKDD